METNFPDVYLLTNGHRADVRGKSSDVTSSSYDETLYMFAGARSGRADTASWLGVAGGTG